MKLPVRAMVVSTRRMLPALSYILTELPCAQCLTRTPSGLSLKLVVNSLDMWTFIERAYNGISGIEKKRIEIEVGPLGKNPVFYGFDGNYEGEYMGIARFLVEDMGRFESFKGRGFNSHMPAVERYRKMTALFEPMRATLVGRELTFEEITKLLKCS